MNQIIDFQIIRTMPLEQLLMMLPPTWSGTGIRLIMTFMLLWRGLKTPTQSGEEELWMADIRPSIIILGVFSYCFVDFT